MPRKSPLERIVFTNGENGIVRLPPTMWKAFYDAAVYLEFDSVQETFISFLLCGGSVRKTLNFVDIVDFIESRRAWLEMEVGRRRREIDAMDDIPF